MWSNRCPTMKQGLQLAMAVLAGVLGGSFVNIALVMLGPLLIAPPAGVDMSDMESFAAAVDSMGPQHFLFPFLAHALGTFTGALLAYRLATDKRSWCALAIGLFFLAGGITAAAMIPAPAWFVILDLVAAYLPMAWLAILLARKFAAKVSL